MEAKQVGIIIPTYKRTEKIKCAIGFKKFNYWLMEFRVKIDFQ